MGIVKPTSWRIRNRLLLVSAVPCILIVLILTGYHLVTQIQSEKRYATIFGQAIATNSGVLSELGIISGDNATLEQLARSINSQIGVIGVAFFDEAKALLLLDHRDLTTDELDLVFEDNYAAYYRDDERYFIAAVSPSSVEVSDFEESNDFDRVDFSLEQNAGWVVIFLDESRMVERRALNVRNAILIGVAGLIVALVISIVVARSIVIPLQSVSRTVGQIANGNFKSRVRTSGGGEVGKLQSGINQMAELIDGHSAALKREVEVATEQLQQTLSELEKRNEELQGANQLAEAASAAKDKFVARMSHELRTPITSISGFLELMRATPLSEQQAEFIQIATQASTTLLGTINDILEVSEIQQSKIELHENEFDLEATLDNMMSMHAWSAYEKGVELVINLDQDVPKLIKSDEIRLIQICNNLVANSVKFTDSGQVVVSVSTSGEMNDRNEMLVFSVRDSGIGIDKEHLIRIFEPFYQGDTSIRRRFGGTGLGLLIARTMVEKMGGQLSIESRIGKGTEVTFTIPVFATPVKQLALPSQPDTHLLIFDTNLWSQRSIRNRALNISHNVYVCGSIERLPAMLKANRPAPDILIVSLSASISDAAHVKKYLGMISAHYRGNLVLLLSTLNLEAFDTTIDQFEFARLRVISKPLRNNKFYHALEPGDVAVNQTSMIGSPSGEYFDVDFGKHHFKVLLAEDNNHNRKLIELLLVKSGLLVTSVADGEQALAELERTDFDLALLDLHMPGIDGVEVARCYQNSTERQRCALLLLTADPVSQSDGDLQLAGFQGVLRKPLNQEDLWATIQKILLPQPSETSTTERSRPLLEFERGSLKAEVEVLLLKIELSLREGTVDEVLEVTHQMKGLTGLSQEDVLYRLCLSLEALVAAGEQSEQFEVLGKLKTAAANLPGT